MTERCWTSPRLAVELTGGEDSPMAMVIGLPGRSSLLRSLPLVEVFTSSEQRARTSETYIRSAIGERLRLHAITSTDQPLGLAVHIDQRDARTGLTVLSRLQVMGDAAALRISHQIINGSDKPVVLTAVATVLGFGHDERHLEEFDLGWASSEWLAENRWRRGPLRDTLPRLDLALHAQNGRGRFALSSTGAWSTGQFMPLGVLGDERTTTSLAWQIESGVGWNWELGQTTDGGFLTLTGPTDREQHFAERLKPHEQFTSVPVTVALGADHADSAFQELTLARRASHPGHGAAAGYPIIYNDFMNTLMGDPTTEKLLPLIDAAAESGAEYFCIDAGWFADQTDWWNGVGDWREAPDRFTDGLAAVIERIHALGMRSGLWIEPEVVGVESPLAKSLPDNAFFQRFGARVLEHSRYQLDFRHPAVVSKLDATVDHLVDTYGISFLKLDYNIDPGVGTDYQAAAPGGGLLAHSRAFTHWLDALASRHPNLLIENCSSGAMRMDYAYLSRTHLQSTSDQQDFRLYPPIAASAPAAVLPEQAGNWAYPSRDMTDAETVFALAAGFAGRLYLSGFLDELRPEQRRLVREAVGTAKRWRGWIAEALPSWPLGLPKWDDAEIAVALHAQDEGLLVLWSRSDGSAEIHLPYEFEGFEAVFPLVQPSGSTWLVGHRQQGAGSTVVAPPGFSAQVYRLRLT